MFLFTYACPACGDGWCFMLMHVKGTVMPDMVRMSDHEPDFMYYWQY